MSRVLLDADLNAKLHGLNEQVEICDENGQTKGRFVPEDAYQKLLYQLAESRRPTLSPDEIQRRRQSQGQASLAAVLQKLGAP